MPECSTRISCAWCRITLRCRSTPMRMPAHTLSGVWWNIRIPRWSILLRESWIVLLVLIFPCTNSVSNRMQMASDCPRKKVRSFSDLAWPLAADSYIPGSGEKDNRLRGGGQFGANLFPEKGSLMFHKIPGPGFSRSS